MTGFAQNTPYHHLDVWAHTAKAVACAPKDRLTRLAALLHDVGCLLYTSNEYHVDLSDRLYDIKKDLIHKHKM